MKLNKTFFSVIMATLLITWLTPAFGYDENRVRYIMVDISLGGPMSYYRGFPDDENVVEALYRIDHDVIVTNTGDFERHVEDGGPGITFSGIFTRITGSEVILDTDISELSQNVIRPAPSNSPVIRVLPSALVASSIMDQYNFYDPFTWHLNVGAKRSLEYNETANTLSFGLSGIGYKYKERTQLYLLFSGISIDSVITRYGNDIRRKLPYKYVTQSSDEGVSYQAFYYGSINWENDNSFTAFISSHVGNNFSVTLIAQDPSQINKFLESAGDLIFGQVLSVVRLLGYSDTYATSYARYECVFGSTLEGVSKITNAERIKLLILKPLISSIKMFRHEY